MRQAGHRKEHLQFQELSFQAKASSRYRRWFDWWCFIESMEHGPLVA